MVERCNHFLWIDDALCDRLRSMVVALINKNKALANEIHKLQKIGAKAEKQYLKLLKEKNRKLKHQLSRSQIWERLILWGFIVIGVVIAVVKAVGEI